MIKGYLKNNKGFTLVEIVVVIVILAILAAISIPSLAGYISYSQDRSRETETQSIAKAAETAVLRAYKVGTKINDINGDDDIGNNLRTKILTMTGTTGEIVKFHVSTGEFDGETPDTPAPNSLNFTKAGTLEYLEYKGTDGDWYGEYRVLADGSTQVRVDKVSFSKTGNDGI